MKHHFHHLQSIICTIALGVFFVNYAVPAHSQPASGAKSQASNPYSSNASQGFSTDSAKKVLENIGMKVEKSSPAPGQELLTTTWDHNNFHYEVFISVSQNKWVWFLSPLQGIPDPSQIPASILLELLHQNDQNGGWYFSWDPDQKRFYLNHLFYYSEFTEENVKNQVALYEKVLAQTLRYWDPQQWNNPSAPIPSITPQ